MAMRLKEVLKRHGFDSFVSDSPTNQQFLLLENHIAQDFMHAFDADEISHPDSEHTVVRMTCSWATTQEDIDQVEAMLSQAEADAEA